ncbi:MAG: VWA domain-containing protein [Candidatus Thorarchaeota archaeon]|nr:VWA domain-containing protein [Candidatus Thorarchaeota archaeon]MCK5239430.1 VWA domain-containing protein [Candidatus Thorarchaeota archaeon]
MSERLGQLDLVFVVDNTGSMGPYIEQTKSKILEIIRTIKKEELCHRLRVGLVAYRDHPPEETSWTTQKYELSSDTHKIEENVKKMQASGGGDGPEAVSTAMNVANRMEFLRDAAKVVVLVADAPPHGVESGDRWPDGTPDGADWKKESKVAYDKGIVYHPVGCYPEIAGYQKAVETFQKIAKDTEGIFFPLTKAEELVKLITGIATEEIDKIAIQAEILKELGVNMDEFAGAELTEEKIQSLYSRIKSKGMTKRAIRAAPSSASSAAGEFEVSEEEVNEDDVKEALRQLKKKS